MLESIIGFHKGQCAVRENVAKSYYKTKIQIREWMTGWHGILSRHVLTALLSLAGWLQKGCHSKKGQQAIVHQRSFPYWELMKIEMIDESYRVRSIFSSFLLSPPQLHCLSPALRVRHQSKAFLVKAETVFGQSVRVVGSTPESRWHFCSFGFRENHWQTGLPKSFT